MIEPVDARNPTPGSLLRHQRQHIGWTVEEIANALCLSPELIRALEADEYSGMGGSTFILGYLRGYARLVGIDVEDAIVRHRDSIPEYVAGADHAPRRESEGDGRGRSRRRRGRVLGIGVVAIGAAAAAAYYFWPRQVADGPRVTDGLTVEMPADGAGSATAVPPERLDRRSAVDPDAVARALLGGTELPLNLTLADIDPTGSGQGAPEAGTTDDAARHVVLLFDESSWADVRDSAGNRLLSQTVAAGSSVDLVGEPPFTVFLGNAGGVRVKYLGRIQTYSQSKKGLFARFTVGQEQ